MGVRGRLLAVAILAVAMAFMESATVLYLRTLAGRVEPYQPDPLPLTSALGRVELLREAATLILLAAAAALAGATWRQRVGYWLFAFGSWDALYYVFLRLLGPWPRSPFDWDVLFLLPLPWWGPVLAPVAVASLMVLTGVLLIRQASGEGPWPRPGAWRAAGAGVALALAAFMADAVAALPEGPQAVRMVLPTSFRWGWFLPGLGLMAAPAVDLIRRGGSVRSRVAA